MTTRAERRKASSPLLDDSKTPEQFLVSLALPMYTSIVYYICIAHLFEISLLIINFCNNVGTIIREWDDFTATSKPYFVPYCPNLPLFLESMTSFDHIPHDPDLTSNELNWSQDLKNSCHFNKILMHMQIRYKLNTAIS